MTKQIPDTVIYKNEEYDLAGLKGGNLFTPAEFSIFPTGFSTGCYRGYFCEYTCNNNHIYLTQLSVFNSENQLPTLNDVQPENIHDIISKYRNLRVLCPFSGGMVIVKNPVEYNWDTRPNPLEYRTVLEINFERGLFQREIDYSNQVDILRSTLEVMWNKLTDDPNDLPEKLYQWMTAPEQLTVKDAKTFKTYFEELFSLEWSFVEGYEQQPPR